MCGLDGAMTENQLLSLLQAGSGGRISAFKPGQWEAIADVLAGGAPTLLVERTCCGKSLVYFSATLALRRQGAGPTLLVSPLLSLMRDQMRAAEGLGLRAATINSENEDQWSAVAAALAADRIDILLVSPEKLASEGFLGRYLASALKRIELFVVDEAHCISDWGHDFRPDYQRIRRLLADRLPAGVAVLATTATANDRVVADVQAQLGEATRVIRGPLARDTLCLQTIRLPSRAHRYAWLAEHLAELPGSGIVYALTRRDAEALADWLKGQGLAVEAYHAKLEGKDTRRQLEQALRDNRLKALVATTALGMGFDKPDLGFVVHFQAPQSVVHYYQQVGRAGRALDRAYGILLSGDEDDGINAHFIEDAFPEERHIREVLDFVEDSEIGLNLEDVLDVFDWPEGRIERILKLLTVGDAPPVVAEAGLWRPTLSPYCPDTAGMARLAGLRQGEWGRMRDYLTTRRCLMSFLTGELDDPAAEQPCGRCANCLGRPLLNPRPDRRLVRAAAAVVAGQKLGWQRAKRPAPPLWWVALKAVFGKG